ncbi:hypothetical protein JCM5350_002875 [Sporobolomyces pararoseus]
MCDFDVVVNSQKLRKDPRELSPSSSHDSLADKSQDTIRIAQEHQMSASGQQQGASTSSQARKTSLFSFGFKPSISSTSSPSTRSSAPPGPSATSSNTIGARSQSVKSEDSASTKNSNKSSRKGSRPGRVAEPGAGLAALKRLATAPAVLPTQAPLPIPISRQSSISQQPDSSSTPSEPTFEPLAESEDVQQTPKRAKDLTESSPTPRGAGAVSSPSRRLGPQVTPLATLVKMQLSSATLRGEDTVEDSDPESTQPRDFKLLSSQTLQSGSLSRRATPPPVSSDEDEIIVSSQSTSSSASTCSTPARKKKVKTIATPSSARKTPALARKPSASPAANRPTPCSNSRAPSSSRPSPAPPTRSSARIRSQSVEAPQPLPRLALVNATSSIANLSTTEESSDSLHLRPIPTRSRSNTPVTSQERSTTPRAHPVTRSSSRPPSLPPPSSDEFSAFPTTPNRTPSGRSRFERDPTGSPLSELAPTPKKIETKKPLRLISETTHHTFELVIDQPPLEKLRKIRAGSVRRARSTATSEYTDRPSSEGNPRRIKEESEEEEDGEQSGDEATDEDEESSRPNRRRSSSIARGKRRADSSSPPRSRRNANQNKHESDSSSSLSSSSSSGEEEEEEEEEENDREEDMFAALARARARKAAGQTLITTSPGVSEVSTAPTTASSAHAAQEKDDGHARRSSRAKHQTDRYSPTAVLAGSSRGTTSTQANTKGKGKARNDGDRTFDKMMKELQAQKQKGRGSAWYEAQKEFLGNSDDELDRTSDNSDEDLPDLNFNNSTHLDTLAQGIAGAVSEDDLLSPDKAAHKKRAREVASILGDEEKKKLKAGLAGETPEERQARTIWRDSYRFEAFDAEVLKGEGWIGQIAAAIRDGLTNPQRFPSSIVLCSRIATNDSQAFEDCKIAANWLISLVCNPATPASLADKLFNLLQRITQIASRSNQSSNTSLLDKDDLVKLLLRLGGDSNKLLGIKETVEESEPDSEEEDDLMELELLGTRATTPPRKTTKPLTVEARVSAVEKWCRVVQIASSSRSPALDKSATTQLVEVCVKLCLEPTSSVLRGPLERTIVSLLHSPSAQELSSLFEIFHRLAALYRSSRPRTQVEVLRCLPHQTISDKKIRKWLAWAFMAEEEAFEQVVENEASFAQSLLPLLLQLVKAPPATSAFNPPATSTDSSNDIKLFQQATLLLISFTDLDDDLNVGAQKTEAQNLVDQIRTAVKKIDGKLRADARKGLLVERIQAKNLLTSITNSLDYQLRRARGQQSGGSVMDVFQDSQEGDDEHQSKKIKAESMGEEKASESI